MTEFTPIKTPRKDTQVKKARTADQRLRDSIIVDTCAAWVKADPQGAKDFMLETKMMKDSQRKHHGGYEHQGKQAGMYVKYRIPQMLLDCTRIALEWAQNEYNVEFEVFGLDDRDMKLLCQTFPDLFKWSHNMTWGKGKK